VLVGRVSHYYTDLGVAALKLEAPLHKGDHLHIAGRTTDLSLTLDSVEINRKKVEVAYAGDDVAMKVPSRVRPGDSVYVETPPRQGGVST
jgi:putative protease